MRRIESMTCGLAVGFMLLLMAGGAMAGAVLWATKRRGESFARVVESCAYYLNPFEYWAYSRDANWPPAALLPMLGPRKPIVQGFATLR